MKLLILIILLSINLHATESLENKVQDFEEALQECGYSDVNQYINDTESLCFNIDDYDRCPGVGISFLGNVDISCYDKNRKQFELEYEVIK